MYLFTIGIHLMVCLFATIHHPDYKGFRNALITLKGIRQDASEAYHELNLNSMLAPINFHQKPWAAKTTNETTEHSSSSCPENAGTTNETTGHSLYSCPGKACATNETTGPSMYYRTGEVLVLQHPTPLVQTRPPAPRQAIVIQKKDKDATALYRKIRDAAARLKTHRTQVAELRSGKVAGANDLLWKMMEDVTKGAEECWEEAAGLVFLAFCGWVYGIDWLLPISVIQLLQIIFGGWHKQRRAQRTYRWKHNNVPELVTGRGSTKKRARLFRRYLKGKQ